MALRGKCSAWDRPEVWDEKWADWPMVSVKQLGPRRYLLLEDFTWRGVTVPKGFITDAASIPRFAWWWTRPEGIFPAALIHDWDFNQCGEDGARTLKQSNRALRGNVEALGYRKSKAWVVWAGPATWGRSIWNRYMELKTKAKANFDG